MKIYIDFKSPASYLALEPTLALIQKHQWDVQWLPFRTKQDPITEEHPGESKTERHLRVRADARRAVHLRYAEVQGLEMTFRADPGETDLALSALLAVGDDPLPFMKAAFEAYWSDGADLGQLDVVADLLKGAGYGPVELSPGIGPLEAIQAQAVQEKVIDAPAYVLQGQVFVGREHLPWVEEMMND